MIAASAVRSGALWSNTDGEGDLADGSGEHHLSDCEPMVVLCHSTLHLFERPVTKDITFTQDLTRIMILTKMRVPSVNITLGTGSEQVCFFLGQERMLVADRDQFV